MTELQYIYLVVGVFTATAIGLPTYVLIHAYRVQRIIDKRAADERKRLEQARFASAAKQKNYKANTDGMSVLEFFS